MLAEEMAEAIRTCARDALDEVTRALWTAVGAGQIGDEDAIRLSEAIDARRVPSKGAQATAGWGFLPGRGMPPRKHQRSPDRAEALEKSRRWAAAGRMPPNIAMKFTSGEQAALAVIAFEFGKRQFCDKSHREIGDVAGVSESTVKRAIRQARKIGLLTVQERRLSRYRNDTNVLRIISKAWLAWIDLRGARGGVQPRTGTNTSGLRKGRSENREGASRSQGGATRERVGISGAARAPCSSTWPSRPDARPRP